MREGFLQIQARTINYTLHSIDRFTIIECMVAAEALTQLLLSHALALGNVPAAQFKQHRIAGRIFFEHNLLSATIKTGKMVETQRVTVYSNAVLY